MMWRNYSARTVNPLPATRHKPMRHDVALGSAAGIELEDVTLVRGATTVFEGLTLSMSERRIGVIGDNGAGKSSLFRVACGLERPQAGRVRVNGRELRPNARTSNGVGMMFQNPDDQIIFPTVDEEVGLGLQAHGVSRREAKARAREWLAGRGLGHWVERAVASLSQGQRQHVCWLALMISAPGVLLLDEPFASLDLPGQALLQREIERAEPQVFVSTHVLEHVRDFARVVWLDHGRIRADGPGREVCAAYEADVAARLRSRALQIHTVRGA